MRLLRLLAFAAVVALIYFAQVILDHGVLADFFPEWLLTAAPPLRRMTYWRPQDLLTFALWLSAIGLLGFGLLTPLWNGERNRLFRPMRQPTGWLTSRSARVLASLVLVVALALALFTLWLATGTAPLWLWAIWLGAMAAYISAGVLADRSTSRVTLARSYARTVNPSTTWPALLLLLAALAAFYLFDLATLPGRVDGVTAAAGLYVRRLLQSAGPTAFAPDGSPLPLYAPTLLTTWLTRDGLLGARLAGVLAALAFLAGVWLVGTELFRRTPHYGEYGEVLEDDGRWMAFLATLIGGTVLAAFHFSRTPILLDVVALGAWSAWALLRGLRNDSLRLLGAAGALLGWTWLYGSAALGLTLAFLLWWVGAWILERGWLAGLVLVPQRSATPAAEAARPAAPVRVQRGVGWVGFAYWAAGVGIGVAPLLGAWIASPELALQYLTWTPGVEHGLLSTASGWGLADALWDNLRNALLGLSTMPDQSGLTGYNAHFLSSLLAPLLMLASGALLLNLDSLVGWILLTWTGSLLLIAALAAPFQPYWPALLPLLPPLSLALAFCLDRIRVFLMQNLGSWTLQGTVYLAVGVVVASALVTWVNFYQAGRNTIDLASAVGRAVRPIGHEAAIVVLDGQENLGSLAQQPVVQFLAGNPAADEVLTIRAGEWPAALPAPVRVLVAPADVGLIPALQARYPGGTWTVMRNLRADPVLYTYDLPRATE